MKYWIRIVVRRRERRWDTVDPSVNRFPPLRQRRWELPCSSLNTPVFVPAHTRPSCGMSDSDHRLRVKLGSVLLQASIGGRSAIFCHWFENLDAILKSFSPASLSISSFSSSSSLRVHSSCPTLGGRMRTQKSSTTNKQCYLSKSMMVCERPLRERQRSVVINRCRTLKPASVIRRGCCGSDKDLL